MDEEMKKRLVDDVLDLLVRAGGRECVSSLLGGLRGGGFGQFERPTSGRRWRNLGTNGEFKDTLRSLGLKVARGIGPRGVRGIYVEVA